MKTFEIVLTKSYIVKIKTENKELAKEYTTLFTSDIADIATKKDKEKYNFVIENIECKINEVYEVIQNEK